MSNTSDSGEPSELYRQKSPVRKDLRLHRLRGDRTDPLTDILSEVIAMTAKLTPSIRVRCYKVNDEVQREERREEQGYINEAIELLIKMAGDRDAESKCNKCFSELLETCDRAREESSRNAYDDRQYLRREYYRNQEKEMEGERHGRRDRLDDRTSTENEGRMEVHLYPHHHRLPEFCHHGDSMRRDFEHREARGFSQRPIVKHFHETHIFHDCNRFSESDQEKTRYLRVPFLEDGCKEGEPNRYETIVREGDKRFLMRYTVEYIELPRGQSGHRSEHRSQRRSENSRAHRVSERKKFARHWPTTGLETSNDETSKDIQSEERTEESTTPKNPEFVDSDTERTTEPSYLSLSDPEVDVEVSMAQKFEEIVDDNFDDEFY